MVPKCLIDSCAHEAVIDTNYCRFHLKPRQKPGSHRQVSAVKLRRGTMKARRKSAKKK
jgi:hypothetical protein